MTKAEVEEDLAFLRVQITTMEVNIARVYNEEVKWRRESKASQQPTAKALAV